MGGELLASAIVEEIVSKLGSWVGSELGLLWNLNKDLQAMKTTLESIEAVLYDAENRSPKERSVYLWLKKLKAAAYDIEDMLDQFQTQNHFFYFPIMAHRLKGMRKRLDNIAAERSRYNLREEAVTDQRQMIEGRATFSAVSKDEILGRDQEATEIISDLLLMSTAGASTAFSIIPIVGIGGLGKTTLAKLIFNDDRMKVFDTKIWIHAMDFEVEKLAEAIISSSGTENSNNLGNLESKVKKVKEIIDGKKFLIVLDDVWNEDGQKWEDFKQILQGGKFGSRIIVTTRSEQVTSIMGAQTSHKLKPLSNKACLELFKQRAFGPTGAGDNHLLSIAEEIVEKCQGVPLIAKTLGGMLHFRSGETAWKKVRDSEFWQLNDAEGGHASEKKITYFLELSYQHMPSRLKLCFVYSSFYPKAFKLDKDMLIQQWIAQRFIQAKGIGEDYVKYLLAISFLEEIKPTVFYYESHVNRERKTYMKMHDLVYDLARSVAEDEVSVLDAGESTTIYPEECRYASIIWYHHKSKLQKYHKSKLQKAFMCKVRALSFHRCSSPPKKIFSWTKCLRVLDLNNCYFDRLPTSIYKLKQLRYLNILGNVGEVDERIGKLWALGTLIVSEYAYIQTLVDSFCGLQNLNNLKIANCSNFICLPESLANLVNLETLDIENCYNLSSLSESLGDLVNLKTLNIKNCPSICTLPVSIGNLYNLIYLDLSFCRELLELPNSIGSLQTLESLNLRSCHKLRSLPECLGYLMEIRTLDIQGCPMLDELPKAFYDITRLKIHREEPPELGPGSDVQLYIFKGPSAKFKVQNISNAKRINLKERGTTKSLTYNCGNDIIDDGIKRAAAAMLEALQPHQNLQRLCIRDYECSNFPSWMKSQMESFLPNLVKIKFIGVYYCQQLPVLGQLPKLEEVFIKDMPKVRRISEEFSGAKNTGWTSFPSLRRLEFSKLWGLEEWVTAAVAGDEERETSLFPCLEELIISNCPKLCIRPSIPLSVETLDIQRSITPLLTMPADSKMSLKQLTINRVRDLIKLPESMRHLTSLETLKLVFCGSLATLPEWLGELSSLRSLEIYDCSLIDCLPESIRRLVALESLIIKGCSESLMKRTQQWTGEDWDKISHISNIKVSTATVALLPRSMWTMR